MTRRSHTKHKIKTLATRSAAGKPLAVRKPSMATKASDRKFHDAFHAMMLDRTIVSWYQDKDTGHWYVQETADTKMVMIPDPAALLARASVTGKNLSTACSNPIPAKNKNYAKRLQATFKLFDQVVAVETQTKVVTERRPLTDTSELLQLFAS